MHICIGLAAAAQSVDVSAEISVDARVFVDPPANPDQQLNSTQLMLELSATLDYESDDGRHRARFTPVLRIDDQDEQRSRFDFKEAYYEIDLTEDVSLLLGNNVVFWGRTESLHLVDIINQTDVTAGLDLEDKLGQTMGRLQWRSDWGVIDFFAMTEFRDRVFPGEKGRLRSPAVIDATQINRENGRKSPDFAVRYSNYMGDWDYGISVFSGTSREARLRFDAVSVTATYDEIVQIGADVQYIDEALLWKLEAIYRESSSYSFSAFVFGFEHTSYQIFDTNFDLGIITEIQYDDRENNLLAGALGLEQETPLTVGNNDVFTGLRVALNDTQDTSILGGLTVDIDDGSTLFILEGNRRIGENWVIKLEALASAGAPQDNPVVFVKDDNYLSLNLKRFF